MELTASPHHSEACRSQHNKLVIISEITTSKLIVPAMSERAGGIGFFLGAKEVRAIVLKFRFQWVCVLLQQCTVYHSGQHQD